MLLVGRGRPGPGATCPWNRKHAFSLVRPPEKIEYLFIVFEAVTKRSEVETI